MRIDLTLYLNILAYCCCTAVLLYTDEMIKVLLDIFVSFPSLEEQEMMDSP